MSNYLTLPIEIEQVENGHYLATSPALPGFLMETPTVEEIYRDAGAVARALLDTYREMGKPIPPELQSSSDHLSIRVLIPA
ncbi:MAG: type II toxin-antitoxin system HicB family antitoxin [Anaerolineae bacterium]|nr:type II toxin-antitoxin system HicB family antitoxin [Anaerolineae bacterium]